MGRLDAYSRVTEYGIRPSRLFLRSVVSVSVTIRFWPIGDGQQNRSGSGQCPVAAGRWPVLVIALRLMKTSV